MQSIVNLSMFIYRSFKKIKSIYSICFIFYSPYMYIYFLSTFIYLIILYLYIFDFTNFKFLTLYINRQVIHIIHSIRPQFFILLWVISFIISNFRFNCGLMFKCQSCFTNNDKYICRRLKQKKLPIKSSFFYFC